MGFTLGVFLAVVGLVLANSRNVVELDTTNFDTYVAKDEHVWVVEFASKFCESCKEFTPIFHSLAVQHSAVKFGACYIDQKPGFDLAKRFDVLEIGLPVVVVFDDVSGKFSTIPIEDPSSKEKIVRAIKNVVSKLKKAKGVFWKHGAKGAGNEL